MGIETALDYRQLRHEVALNSLTHHTQPTASDIVVCQSRFVFYILL